jgi:hypothetical protein
VRQSDPFISQFICSSADPDRVMLKLPVSIGPCFYSFFGRMFWIPLKKGTGNSAQINLGVNFSNATKPEYVSLLHSDNFYRDLAFLFYERSGFKIHKDLSDNENIFVSMPKSKISIESIFQEGRFFHNINIYDETCNDYYFLFQVVEFYGSLGNHIHLGVKNFRFNVDIVGKSGVKSREYDLNSDLIFTDDGEVFLQIDLQRFKDFEYPVPCIIHAIQSAAIVCLETLFVDYFSELPKLNRMEQASFDTLKQALCDEFPIFLDTFIGILEEEFCKANYGMDEILLARLNPNEPFGIPTLYLCEMVQKCQILRESLWDLLDSEWFEAVDKDLSVHVMPLRLEAL